jgi:diguanylate cyclase (GGDEF)-like protein
LCEQFRRIASELKLSAVLSASIGIAELSSSNADLAAWIDNADRALYRAKQSGRDLIVISGAIAD